MAELSPEAARCRAAWVSSGGMIRCVGCGFLVEVEHARANVVTDDAHEAGQSCATCFDREAQPKMRESYRRGFNAGVDALAAAVTGTIAYPSVRRRD